MVGLNRNLGLLFAASFTVAISNLVIQPLFPLYLDGLEAPYSFPFVK
jgi:hypothetical protein